MGGLGCVGERDGKGYMRRVGVVEGLGGIENGQLRTG